jgi:ParB/RepB/Spo0J family partition protein
MGALKLETLAAAAEPTEVIALQPVAAVALMGIELRHFPLDALYIGGNYRTAMSAPGLEELTESIRHSGLIQPITVRPLGEPVEGKHFALVAGARRYAAHERAGLPTILCNVREMSAQQAEEARLIENVQRENPHPADEAVAVGKLSENGATYQEIASRLGKPLRWVAQRKAVSQLVGTWLRALRADKVTLAAAEELARWPQAVQARLAAENYKNLRDATLSESTVKYWLQSETHVLSAAPWSLHDADLYPQAGACVTCPKRSSCAGVLFEQPGKGKDSCLDKGCWGIKLARCTALAIKEGSTDEQPAYRLSSRSYETPAGALSPGRYEVSKKKKGTVVGVFIDGPQQAHTVRILLVGLPAAAQKNHQEAQQEARRKRLTQQATKSVLAGRVVVLLGQPDEEGEQVRRVLLGEAITERLLHHRTALDELVLAHLVRDWKWSVMQDKTRKALRGDEYRQWVRAQVQATAPTEEVLTRLLLYVLAHHDLSSEYNDQQQKVVTLLNRPELTQGLAEAAQDRLAQQYDPLTLRARS